MNSNITTTPIIDQQLQANILLTQLHQFGDPQIQDCDLPATHAAVLGVTSQGQLQQQIIFDSNPQQVQYQQFLGQPQQIFLNQSALQQLAAQNPLQFATSSNQNPLQNAEPFSTASIQHTLSAGDSNIHSHKSSFHSDDSFSASPQQIQNAAQQQESQPAFSRQSTKLKSNRITEVGAPSNAKDNQNGEDDQEEEEDTDFTDLNFEQTKIPVIQLSVSDLQITLTLQNREENKVDSIQQDSEDKSSNNFILSQSLTSSNLINLHSSNPQSQPFDSNNGMTSQSLQQQEHYQTLTIGQSIWSHQIPSQTQEEFLQTQSQIVQQQNHMLEMHTQQKITDISDVQKYIQQTNIAQQQQQNPSMIQQQPQQQQPQPQNLSPSPQTLYASPQILINQGLQNQQQIPYQFLNQQNFQSQNMSNTASQQLPQSPLVIGNLDQQNITDQNAINAAALPILSQQSLINPIYSQANQNLQHEYQMLSSGLSQQVLNQSQQLQLQHHILNSNSTNIQLANNNQDIAGSQVKQGELQQIIPGQQQVIIQQESQQQQEQQKQQKQIAQPQMQAQEHSYNKCPSGSFHLDQPINTHLYDHKMYLAQLHAKRQINRYFLNPIYKSQGHKLGSQGSFRAGTQSPILLLPGNLSVLRSPPGFEHFFVNNTLNYQLQAMNIEQNQLNPQQLQQNQLQGIGLQPQQIQTSLQQQQQQPNNGTQAAKLQETQLVQYVQQVQQAAQQQQQIQQQLMLQQQQQHQIQNQQNQQIIYPYQNSPNQNSSGQFSVYPQLNQNPQNPIYSSFFSEQIRIKQSQLDEQLRKTTQQLDHKLLESIELQEIWTEYDKSQQEKNAKQQQQNYEQREEQKEEQSKDLEQANKVHPFVKQDMNSYYLLQQECEQNEQPLRESKERIELFKKLQNQLGKLKQELLQQNEQQTKLSPFSLDPGKYLEKILNLMIIINEVDSHTNLAEMKNEYEKTKAQLEKMRSERQKFFGELSQVTIQYHELENNHQKLQSDHKLIREQQMKEREQLEMIIKTCHENLKEMKESNEQLQLKVKDLQIQIENETNKKKNSTSNTNANTIDKDYVKHIKQEYGKKIAESQKEASDLKDYIKRRSQEEQSKRYEEKKAQELENKKLKEELDLTKKSTDQIIKDKETEIRILNENILRFDPDFFQKHLIIGTEKLKECPDCKKRELKIQDQESRIKELTDYIKSSTKRLSSEKQKYEEQILKLNQQNQQLSSKINNKQDIIQAFNNQLKQYQDMGLIDKPQQQPQPSESKFIIQQSLFVTTDLINKIENVLDQICQSNEYGSNMSLDYKVQISQIRQNLYHKLVKQAKLSPQDNKQHQQLEEIKEECLEDDIMLEHMSSSQSIQSSVLGSNNAKDSINELLMYLESEFSKEIQVTMKENQEKREAEFFNKVELENEINEQYKDIMKEGRTERKHCHQVIVEVEKLMYKMNSLLITEQMNIEQLKTQDPLKNLPQQLQTLQLDQRADLNAKYRQVFSMILEAYLELPLKLKPIFDRIKKFEHIICKFFKADPSLLYDLTSEIVSQYKTKNEILSNQLESMEVKCNESQSQVAKIAEENQQHQQKVIQLNEKIVQINSAYNALQKHLFSTKGLSSNNQSQSNQHVGQANVLGGAQQMSMNISNNSGSNQLNSEYQRRQDNSRGGLGNPDNLQIYKDEQLRQQILLQQQLDQKRS